MGPPPANQLAHTLNEPTSASGGLRSAMASGWPISELCRQSFTNKGG